MLQLNLNGKVTSNLIKDEQRIDISSDLHQIETPIHILASRFDDHAPVEELQFIYNNVSSTNNNFIGLLVQDITFFFDEPVELRRVVNEFCEAL